MSTCHTESALPPPKRLRSRKARRQARITRDSQWKFMDRVATLGTLWVCWWNKNRHHDAKNLPPDLMVCGLIDGCELLEWISSHEDWWEIGEWNEDRYAAPLRLTSAGRAALAHRERYDMEDVTGGLVEPGFIVTPVSPRKRHRADDPEKNK